MKRWWFHRLVRGDGVARATREHPASGPIGSGRIAGDGGLTNLLSYRLQCGRYRDSPAAGQTITALMHLEAEPFWVRLIYSNDLHEPWTVDGAAIASTSAFDPQARPRDAAGRPDNTLWQPVPFNNHGGDGLPLHQQAGAAMSLAIPPRDPHRGFPAHVLSDWVPVCPVPRADGGHGSLLLVSTYSAGPVRYAEGVGAPHPSIRRLHAGFHGAGNRTVPPFAGPVTRWDNLHACFGLQYVAAANGVTVLGIGDSIMHSACTTGEVSGFGLRACAMVSSRALPVSYINEGFPGRNSTGYCDRGIWDIERLRPQVALIQSWTQNEAWTAASAEESFARALAVAQVARANGCVPILTTPMPVFATEPAGEVHRRANLARVRAAAAQGIDVLDLEALWGAGTTPNSYRPEFDCGDHVHPNDHACAVAAAVLAPILRRIIGIG